MTDTNTAFRGKSLRRARTLVAGTLAYNVAEAVVALWAGLEADSIALLGFGLDSGIEVAASGVVLWRLGVEGAGRPASRVEAAERRAERFIGATFLALALYVTVEAVARLGGGTAADESMVGIALAALSLAVMPALGWAKLRTARRLASASLAAEAKETIACAWLSAALLLGLVANAALGWWWADPVAAAAMVPWLVREGLEAWGGET